MPSIGSSVGRGGTNNRADVLVVQALLNPRLPAGSTLLIVDGLIGPKTMAAIATFQRLNVSGFDQWQSAVISPGDATWSALAGVVATATRSVGARGVWSAKFTFQQFWDYTEPLEGGIYANCMFMVKDLQVATCMGITFKNKLDIPGGQAMARQLDWVHAGTTTKCTDPEIDAAYLKVLKEEETGRKGSGFIDTVWKPLTTPRATEASVKKWVEKRAIENMDTLRALASTPPSTPKAQNESVGDFDAMPADAQLCVLSLSWNGIHFAFPTFREACRAKQWYWASTECKFASSEGTLGTRSGHQRTMMRNAYAAATLGLFDPDKLHFRTALSFPEPADKHADNSQERYRESHQIALMS